MVTALSCRFGYRLTYRYLSSSAGSLDISLASQSYHLKNAFFSPEKRIIPPSLEIWPDIVLNSPTLGAHAPNEGEGWMMHDIKAKAYCTHEANTLPMTNHMARRRSTKRYVDIVISLKYRSRYRMWRDRWPSFRQRRSTREQ